jgi:hypothetical protein
MSIKTVIAEAGNVLSAAMGSLRSLGYTVAIDDDGASFEASNDRLRLIAETPLALLGLVKLHEHRGDNWYPTEVEVDDFLSIQGEGPAQVSERTDVWEDQGVIMLKCVTSGGDPVEMNATEAKAFAALLQEAITKAERA